MSKQIKSDYSDNKRTMCFRADSVLRGINATVKVLAELYNGNDKETVATFNHDGLTVDNFVTLDFIKVAKQYTQNYFDKSGQICRLVKLYESNTETKERYNNLSKDMEYISGQDGNGVYRFFKIPVYKWTTLGLYNFAKRAYTQRAKVAKVAKDINETLSLLSTEQLEKVVARRKASETTATESKTESK